MQTTTNKIFNIVEEHAKCTSHNDYSSTDQMYEDIKDICIEDGFTLTNIYEVGGKRVLLTIFLHFLQEEQESIFTCDNEPHSYHTEDGSAYACYDYQRL